ncbi:DUF624 domain-containing protein [Salipaludibacillus sp. LMS25]|jgi:uncharacterized membrane protein YesL|uniref:YesL family protein n=1 Tax=Salipaludibacillus sp. LMS25 TaxID=2924031 RepID=UPI0020D0B2E9|nr:DUF624 domain-containing protein [Salipaludibacillus sp. LMS25]UTR16538.1 DUF624 domain-containing protein [Salipaludibacillus sp. LMS25]
MQSGELLEKFNSIFVFIYRLALLNLLWMLFTALGLIFFGAGPASAAVFEVSRKIIQRDNPAVFRHFLITFKKTFFKANLFFAVWTVFFVIILADLYLLTMWQHEFAATAQYIILTIMGFFTLFTMQFLAIYTHFDLPVRGMLKNAFIMTFVFPIKTAILISGYAGIAWMMYSVPGLIPMFSFSLIAYFTMWLSLSSFNKLRYIKNNGTRSSSLL